MGSFVDVQGTTALLDTFSPAPDRWDVCVVEAIHECCIRVRAVDRVHPYPFFYPGAPELVVAEWLPLDSPRLRPYLSEIARPDPARAVCGDLVDFCRADGRWQVGEVLAHVGSAIWVQEIDHYASSDAKHRRRGWIDAHGGRFARYRSHAPDRHLAIDTTVEILTPEHRLPPDRGLPFAEIDDTVPAMDIVPVPAGDQKNGGMYACILARCGYKTVCLPAISAHGDRHPLNPDTQ